MRLRELEFSDVDRILEWLQDAESRRFLAGDGTIPTREGVEQFIFSALYTAGDIYRAVVDASDLFLGFVALKNIDPAAATAEFAIALHPDARGYGYAALATDQLLQFAFGELGLARIYMYTSAGNRATIRFNESYGFLPQENGPMQQVLVQGALHDLKWYGMTKEQFYRIRGKEAEKD